MKPISYLVVAVGLAAAACANTDLQPAQIDNIVDTITLGALVGTPISTPSAFSIPDARAVRTDQTASFDFAYNVDATGRRVLLPLDALGLGAVNGANPGLLRSTSTFVALATPPTNGYLTKDTIVVAVGDVIVARSRIACFLGVPEYAKLEILSFDDTKRTVQFQVLANVNCGYRNLEVGIPTN
ncbi:MAG: hypothetical protein ABIZ70_06965 [Gemmatimonadales bacterium]